MSSPQPVSVVTGFVTREGRILLLRRSAKVGTYQGRWAGVSGYLEAPTALAQMYIELEEELSLSPKMLTLEVQGEPLQVCDPDAQRNWLVYPFRFALIGGALPTLDWEHVELKWIAPLEMDHLQTVPGLTQTWRQVALGFWAAPGER